MTHFVLYFRQREVIVLSEMSKRIYQLRRAQGKTLEDVAKIVGVGKSTVRKWETGMIANMRRDKISKLAEALHTTPAYLMGWTEASATEYQKADTISDIIIKLRSDDELLEIVKDVCNLSDEQRVVVKTLLSAFNKDSE